MYNIEMASHYYAILAYVRVPSIRYFGTMGLRGILPSQLVSAAIGLLTDNTLSNSKAADMTLATSLTCKSWIKQFNAVLQQV